MGRLYTYGNRLSVAQQGKYLPGQFSTAWGVNLNAPSVKVRTVDFEYGEIVELSGGGSTSNAYSISRVDSGTTAFGVILRTRDGLIDMEAAIAEQPRKDQTISIYPTAAPNYFEVAVILAENEEPAVGDSVYVSYAAGKEGSVRNDVTSATALTDWVFASTRYKPTDGDDYVALIRKSF